MFSNKPQNHTNFKNVKCCSIYNSKIVKLVSNFYQNCIFTFQVILVIILVCNIGCEHIVIAVICSGFLPFFNK